MLRHLPWAGKEHDLCKFCCKKVEILSTLCNEFCNLQEADLLRDRFERGW